MDPISASIIAGASLGSAGIGVIGANASTKKQYKYQSKLQAQAAKLNYDYSLLSARNLHSATREGLENAGYNPMLAVQNGTSGANSSFTSAGQSSAPDYLGGLSNAFEFQKLSNETKLADTQSNLFNEQSKTEDSKRTNLEFQNAMLDVEKHLKDKDLDTYDRRFYSNLYEQMQRAENYRAQANVAGYNAESARISAEAQKLQSETSSKWTPVGIGAGLAAGVGGFALGKIPALKYLKKAKVGF